MPLTYAVFSDCMYIKHLQLSKGRVTRPIIGPEIVGRLSASALNGPGRVAVCSLLQ